MSFEELVYSKSQIDKAGEILRNHFFNKQVYMKDDIDNALDILNNWRSSHSYVLNTFNATLREKLKRIDPQALVAQRLKRFISILMKLKRRPTMRLSSMQDVGGIRAVMKDTKSIYEMQKDYQRIRFKHINLPPDDYIINPKESGYRCLHLLFRYNNERAKAYNGLNIEVQLRTKMMHAWATAIETVDTFLRFSLKASEGPQEWLDYFKLSANAFAFIEETPRLKQYQDLNFRQNIIQVKEEHKRLHVENSLNSYSLAVNHLTKEQNGSYYILILDSETRELNYISYGKDKLSEANIKYSELEEQNKISGNKQIVLVSAKSLEQLKQSYPNFFLDTHEYLKIINEL